MRRRQIPATDGASVVTIFSCLLFDTPESALGWMRQLTHFLGSSAGSSYRRGEDRAVVFAPLASRDASFRLAVYANAGALNAAHDAGLGTVSVATMGLQSLPVGLALIIGDESDRTIYERVRGRAVG